MMEDLLADKGAKEERLTDKLGVSELTESSRCSDKNWSCEKCLKRENGLFTIYIMEHRGL
jgi:hypothetical protein